VAFLEGILANRRFYVYLGNKGSSWRTVNNGLPQGSVLAPTLFNLYMHDIPVTEGLKFQFADDIAIAFQSKDLKDGSATLTKDLEVMNTYFRNWRLKSDPRNTEVCAFHLNNRQANDKLEVEFDGLSVRHNSLPKYLGITLDRSLTFNEHLSSLSKKIRSRVNLVQMLAGMG